MVVLAPVYLFYLLRLDGQTQDILRQLNRLLAVRTPMIQIDISTLVKRLNPFSRRALEMAATACMSQQATEITVSHVLTQMLSIPRCDLRVIMERAELSVDELGQALVVEHYATMRHTDSYPVFRRCWLNGCATAGCWPRRRCSPASCAAVSCCWRCCILRRAMYRPPQPGC